MAKAKKRKPYQVPMIFYGPKGGRYLDQEHRVSLSSEKDALPGQTSLLGGIPRMTEDQSKAKQYQATAKKQMQIFDAKTKAAAKAKSSKDKYTMLWGAHQAAKNVLGAYERLGNKRQVGIWKQRVMLTEKARDRVHGALAKARYIRRWRGKDGRGIMSTRRKKRK